jgi:hypothetical protein
VAEIIINVLLSSLLLAFLVFVFLPRRKAAKKEPPLTIHDFLPSHHLQFQEVEDHLAEYNDMLQKIEVQRRNTAIAFLEAIQQDFFRLQLLLTHAAKFAPELSLEGEARRFWIGLKFRWECRLARLQIRLGLDAIDRLKALTAKVRLLAEQADKVLNEVARYQGIHTLESDINS